MFAISSPVLIFTVLIFYIQGVTSASKQAAFMEHLIDLVCIADAAEDPQNKLLQEPGLVW